MPEPGIYKRDLRFDYPALHGWQWPSLEIIGQTPGPKLAVIAGVHVNETSSIEAAIRLQKAVAPSELRGRLSIIPVVNLPAVPLRSQYVCPLDDKNINFSFPGKPDGTFAEAIAWALLNDWAADADCFIDLHGGDLCENVSHFTLSQCIGESEFDARNLQIAKCFDAELIVRLDPSHLAEPGRSCTGRATRRQHAAFAEAGRLGIIEENNVLYHFEGVLRVAQLLGMTATAPAKRREAEVVDEYLWVPAPVDGFYRYRVEAGELVAKDSLLAVAENTYGEELARVTAPAAGRILWTITHAFSNKDHNIMGIARRGTEQQP